MAVKYYLANSNLFLNGGDTTGIVKSFEIDNVKAQTEKYESLGMLFNKDVPTGFDQMKGKMTFAGPAPDFFYQAAFPWEKTPITLLGVMTEKGLNGAQGNKQFKAELTIRPDELGVGKFENQKLTEFDRNFLIDKLTVSFGGVEQLAIDAENNIYRVNGVDKWKEYRTLLGQ